MAPTDAARQRPLHAQICPPTPLPNKAWLQPGCVRTLPPFTHPGSRSTGIARVCASLAPLHPSRLTKHGYSRGVCDPGPPSPIPANIARLQPGCVQPLPLPNALPAQATWLQRGLGYGLGACVPDPPPFSPSRPTQRSYSQGVIAPGSPPLPSQLTQHGYSRDVRVPNRPPTRPGQRSTATTGTYMSLTALAPALVKAARLHPGRTCPIGLTRGFQLLPSSPQSWDRSHCIDPKVHGVQNVQPQVHHCWHFGGLLCLYSDPISSPCLIPCTLANPKEQDGAPAGRGPVRTLAFMVLHCMCICPGRQDTPGYICDKTRGSCHSACLSGEWLLHFAAQLCHTPENGKHKPGVPRPQMMTD